MHTIAGKYIKNIVHVFVQLRLPKFRILRIVSNKISKLFLRSLNEKKRVSYLSNSVYTLGHLKNCLCTKIECLLKNI